MPTGCTYADRRLLPLMRRVHFMDQEVFSPVSFPADTNLVENGQVFPG
jgi:hypothetical protein